MADAMMMFLGEAHGVNWYWAQPGEFENPGVYYWDGVKNVLCVPHLAAAPEAPAVARDKLKVLADEYAAQCSEFARKLASGKPDDSMSPIAVAAGDARMALHLAIDAAPEAPAQASAVDERAAFEAWYSSLRNNARTAGLTLLDAWQARAALAKKGGDA